MPFAYDQGEGAVSPAAIADPPAYRQHRAVMRYDDIGRRLVSSLKFADRADLAPWMAKMMAVAAKELMVDRPVVIPTPLHRFRLLQRRYNQAAELARPMAASAGLTYLPLALQRVRSTKRQVGLSASERQRNVQGAFRVPVEWRPEIEGRPVLLVDDVHTTGATLNACARALKRAGALHVDAITFAMVFNGDI